MAGDEATYYARHLRLPGFGAATQDRLRRARVLVVGLGGLGCPAALYLAGMGVGTIVVCDGDVVSETNLHRQVLFDGASVGELKVDAGARRLRGVNPHVRIETVAAFADAASLPALVRDVDLVLDGTDNFGAKFALNDACEAAGVPLVYGSIFQFEGQVSVFHLPTADSPRGWSYRDLYPDEPPPGLAQSCGEAGVVGVLPGVVGTLQATEAFKVITGLGEPLSGHLLTYDALAAATTRLRLAHRARNAPAPATSDLEAADGATIAHASWRALSASDRPPTLLDVREPAERAAASLGGMHIPLASLPARLDEIPGDRDVVVYCKSGLRSARAVLYLQSVRPQLNARSLKGGIDAVPPASNLG